MGVGRPGNGKQGRKNRKAANGRPEDRARQAAHLALAHILEARTPLDDAFHAVLAESRFAALNDRDRRFARALVTTTLRHLGSIETRLEHFLKRRLPRKAAPVLGILRLGLAQLDHMDVPDHAAVASSADLARLDPVATHFVGLINGVLRAAARDRGTAKRRARTVPAWLFRRWRAAHGEENARGIAEAITATPPLDLSIRSDPEGWAEKLGGQVLPTGTVRLSDKTAIPDLAGFEDGAWWVQDAAAALPVRLLRPRADERIFDLCAAPGGKTAQLAASGATVTAVDNSNARLVTLSENLSRLRLDVTLVPADLRTWEPDQPADAVLLDAPCSATGTLRRHPDVVYTKTEEDIQSLAGLQTALLARAGKWVRPGGRLIYCTCSLEPEEGEAQIDAFLALNSGFSRDPVRPNELPGLSQAVTQKGDVRTLPSFAFPADDPSGLDGFFIARLRHTHSQMKC